MTDTFRGILIICLILYFLVVFRLLKSKKLALKYSLLWLLMGFAMVILGIFPQMLEWLSHLFGIVETMNGLFTFAIAFILVLLLSLTSIVSKQSERIKNLIQENALLEKRIRRLENEEELK